MVHIFEKICLNVSELWKKVSLIEAFMAAYIRIILEFFWPSQASLVVEIWVHKLFITSSDSFVPFKTRCSLQKISVRVLVINGDNATESNLSFSGKHINIFKCEYFSISIESFAIL